MTIRPDTFNLRNRNDKKTGRPPARLVGVCGGNARRASTGGLSLISLFLHIQVISVDVEVERFAGAATQARLNLSRFAFLIGFLCIFFEVLTAK